MAGQAGFRNLEMVQQRRDVVAHLLKAHRPAGIRGVAMAPERPTVPDRLGSDRIDGILIAFKSYLGTSLWE